MAVSQVSMNTGLKSLLLKALFAILLIVLCQFTRFTTRGKITVREGSVTFDTMLNHLEAIVDVSGPVAASLKVPLTMDARPGLERIAVTKDSQTLFERSFKAIYLWGRRIAGELPTPTGNFEDSFGDWTMDRLISDPLVIPEFPANLSPPYEIEFSVVGRGGAELVLQYGNSKTLSFSVADGFIDSAIGICNPSGCLANQTGNEPTSMNISRIINIVAEILLGGLLLNFALSALTLLLNLRLLPDYDTITHYRKRLLILAAAHLGFCIWMSRYVLAGIPHISDSAIYYRQALTMAEGMLRAPIPPGGPAEALLSNGGRLVGDSIEYFHAHHFWPALIAVFIKLGIPDLLNPILALGTFFALSFIFNRLLGERGALFALTFWIFSPLTIIMSGDYMMHTATLFFISSGCAFLMAGLENNKTTHLIASGALLAYGLAIRQLTFIGVMAPVILMLFCKYRATMLKRCVWPVLGALPFIIVFLLDNKYLSGSYFKSAHEELHGLTVNLSNFQFGLGMVDSMLGYLLSIEWYSITPYLFFCFAAFAFFLKTRLAAVLFLPFLSLCFAYSFLNTNGMHGYGPRFLFEGTPAIAALAGLTFNYLSRFRIKALTTLLLLIVVSYNIAGLIRILPMYRDYNYIYNAFYRVISAAPLDKSILLVKDYSWQSMDIAATLYDPHYKQLLMIKELPDSSHEAWIKAYPERKVYLVDGLRINPAK